MVRGVIIAAVMLAMIVWFLTGIPGWTLTIRDLIPVTLGVVAGILWVWRFTRYVSGRLCAYPRMSRKRFKVLQFAAIAIAIVYPGGPFVPGRLWLPPLFRELSLGGAVMFFSMSAFGLAWLIRHEAEAGRVRWSAPW
jgi:hypothetical protein